MTPEQKAKQLYDEFFIICQEYTEEIQCGLQAKKCAIVAVSEICEVIQYRSDWSVKYWNEVKKEIEKII